MERYIVLALIAMVLFGVNGLLFKIALSHIDPISLSLTNFIVAAAGTFVYWFFFVTDKQITSVGIGYGFLVGTISVAALALALMALQIGNVSVANTLTRALSAAVTVILAIIFLGEKLTLTKGAGVVFAIIAAVLLAL